MLEKDYKYTGQSPPCAFDLEKKVTRPTAYWHTKGGTETTMIERIFTSTITVAIDAGAYKSYGGGVIGCNAGGKSVNHAVQAVGYDGDQNIWIIRNRCVSQRAPCCRAPLAIAIVCTPRVSAALLSYASTHLRVHSRVP